MSGDKEQTSTNEVRINPELAAASQQALQGSQNIYDQGTGGIFQGSQLAGQNQLVGQGQNQQLDYANQLAGTTNQNNQALSGLVGNDAQALINQAGPQLDLTSNLQGDPMFQKQIEAALANANTQFGRGSQGIFQQGTGAGQFGSSEVGESLGLFGGEVNRNLQNSIVQAGLGNQQNTLAGQQLALQQQGMNVNALQQGQQTALQALGLAPQQAQLGLLPSQIQQDIGNQRTQRSQQELQNDIQQFNAPRQAQMQNQAEFQNFLASNPLMGESTSTNTQVTEGNALQSALGAAATIGGIAGGPIGGMIGGGVSSLFGGGPSVGDLTGFAPIQATRR